VRARLLQPPRGARQLVEEWQSVWSIEWVKGHDQGDGWKAHVINWVAVYLDKLGVAHYYVCTECKDVALRAANKCACRRHGRRAGSASYRDHAELDASR
jgi:hypothetical protein